MMGTAYGTGSTKRDVSVPGAPAWAFADVSNIQLLGSVETG
jgi:hypothetical protein